MVQSEELRIRGRLQMICSSSVQIRFSSPKFCTTYNVTTKWKKDNRFWFDFQAVKLPVSPFFIQQGLTHAWACDNLQDVGSLSTNLRRYDLLCAIKNEWTGRNGARHTGPPIFSPLIPCTPSHVFRMQLRFLWISLAIYSFGRIFCSLAWIM